MLDSTAVVSTSESSSPSTTSSAGARSTKEIESWLTSYLANLLNLPETEIDRTVTFEQFGLDSAAAVAMTGDLARWLEWDLDPNVATQHRTVEALASYIRSAAAELQSL
jgi:acyl carrier protein